MAITEFYPPTRPTEMEGKVAEIRIKLWVSTASTVDQISEISRRIYKLLDDEGFTVDPTDPGGLCCLVSIHAVDVPDNVPEFIESFEEDESCISVLVDT